MTELERLQDENKRLRMVASRLLTTLSGIRGAYETATHDHPDDDIRILHLGYSESAILAARDALYPDESPS